MHIFDVMTLLTQLDANMMLQDSGGHNCMFGVHREIQIVHTLEGILQSSSSSHFSKRLCSEV
ncbi:uncharacterized protein HKW66_Vig0120280 [Vigna angularis]|uniref:Uncharacterized protein n=1 Tax=Phaseolus angularis TaxID=3914 RepID=A0A8T0JWJ0_PHAAN|nr:uncharacterized protein HKW66_Vig0120280 [Vigna angularis]